MRRVESCLTTQLAPVTHYNWRLQSSRDEIVWLIDVRIPWIKFVPTTPLLSYAAHRQDLFQPVHCQCSELDMTAPPHEEVPTREGGHIDAFGRVGAEYGWSTHHHNAPAPSMTGAFSEAFTLCHSQQRRPSKSVLSRKEWQPMLASAFMPWSQAKVEQAIGPRMRRQRISSGRCGLANRNIGRHSNAA